MDQKEDHGLYERLLKYATEAVPEHPTPESRRWDCFGSWDEHLRECEECRKTMR